MPAIVRMFTRGVPPRVTVTVLTSGNSARQESFRRHPDGRRRGAFRWHRSSCEAVRVTRVCDVRAIDRRPRCCSRRCACVREVTSGRPRRSSASERVSQEGRGGRVAVRAAGVRARVRAGHRAGGQRRGSLGVPRSPQAAPAGCRCPRRHRGACRVRGHGHREASRLEPSGGATARARMHACKSGWLAVAMIDVCGSGGFAGAPRLEG